MHRTLITLLVSTIPLCLGINICPTRNIMSPSGRITSPGYPSNYPSNTDCVLTIKQPLDTKITFTFSSIDLEGDDDDGSSCYDELIIKGLKEKTFCGPTRPAPHTEDMNIVQLHFKTDGSVNKKGFDLSYTTTRKLGLPTPVSVCPTREIQASLRGRIMSPAFPEMYNNSLNCKLTMKIPPNKKTEITYDVFRVEYTSDCTNDKLTISDINGKSKTSCGTGNPSTTDFDGTEVYVHFTTNANVNNYGFLLSYRLIDVPGRPTATPQVIKRGCTCSYRGSYIKRPLSRNDIVKRSTDDITLEFKTNQRNGLLLYAKGSVRDYILLKLENGNIVFEVDLGTGSSKSSVLTGNLNDNAWHSVSVKRRRKSVTVTVRVQNVQNEAISTTPGSFDKLDIKGLNAALYVLGGPPGIPFRYNFQGCVKNLVIDGMKPIESVQKNESPYEVRGSPLTSSNCS